MYYIHFVGPVIYSGDFIYHLLWWIVQICRVSHL